MKAIKFYLLFIQLGNGDLANRIITVGHESRGEKIASWLDTNPAPKRYSSSRGFITITGYYHGVMVSIVSIGMVCQHYVYTNSQILVLIIIIIFRQFKYSNQL